MKLPSRLPALRTLTVGSLAVLALSACGSSSHRIPVESAQANPRGALTQTAPITSSSAAPRYCQALTASSSMRGLSAAIDRLAQEPDDPGAHATIRHAASALSAAAQQTSGTPRTALDGAASALTALDQHGLSVAGQVNTALQTAGRTLEGPCAFPVS